MGQLNRRVHCIIMCTHEKTVMVHGARQASINPLIALF